MNSQTDETAVADETLSDELGEDLSATDTDVAADSPPTDGEPAPALSANGTARRARRRERASDKVARVSEERLKQAQDMAGDGGRLRHLVDCPEEGRLPGTADSRVEFFAQSRPNTPDLPESERGKPMLTVRCIECGEEVTEDDVSEG